MPSFIDTLENRQRKNGSLLCVGLDPDWNKIPDSVKEKIIRFLNSTRRLSMLPAGRSAPTNHKLLITVQLALNGIWN